MASVSSGRGRGRPTTGRRTTRGSAAALAALLVLAGCTSGPQDAGPAPTATIEPGPTQAPDDAAVDLPDGPAGEQAAWVVEQLAEPVGTPMPEPEERFAADLLAELPAAELDELLDQLRAAGPFTVGGATGDADAVEVTLRGEVDVLVQVAVDADGRIAGLWFGEPPPERDPAASWQDLLDEVDGLPGSASLLVASVVDGACVPEQGTPVGSAASEPLPMGSVVKLYVLDAVVDAVGRGDLTWDDELTVTDDVRSLPSGELQDAPTGTTVTVEEAARAMIAISDNTATDLLVEAVGRDAVLQALVDSGHHDPALNDPVLTTRELFQVGWGGGADLRRAWRDAAGPAERAAILDGLPGGPVDVDVAEVVGAVAWTHRADWFGTAADLCAAHVALQEQAGTEHGAVVREILSANPGLGGEAQDWAYVAFKGGSATGTMAGAWLVEDADGDARVVVLQTAAQTPQGALPATTMVAMVEDALRLSR